MIETTMKNLDFAAKVIVQSNQTASVLATAGWSNSGNGFSITIPVSGKYRLSVEFNAYGSAGSDGYWCIGIDGVNHPESIRRNIAGTGISALMPTHIEVITDCIAGQVITLRNDESAGDIRADIGSSNNALGYIRAEMIFAYVPNIITGAWQTYPMTIGAVTTPPTKGTIVFDVAAWRKVGKNMEITYTYQQSTAGGAGNGIYLFSLPPGYTIDTTNLQTMIAGHGSCLGELACYNGSNYYVGVVKVYNSTNLACAYDSPSSWISNTAMGLSSAANLQLTFKASVPILGW